MKRLSQRQALEPLSAALIRMAGAALCLVLAMFPANARAADVTVCADPDPPPWSFWVRDAHEQRTDTYEGFAVDLVSTAFQRLHKTVQFIGDMRWSRCMSEVAAGHVDFAMGAYYSDERAAHFAYSSHYSTLTPQAFYLKGRGVSINSIADLKRYKGCGLTGASYAHYGLDAAQLDLGVSSYDAMIRKLKAGRCQYFVDELELIEGFKLLVPSMAHDYLADPEIEHSAVPDAKAPAKHLITAKGSRGEKMLPELDEQLDQLIHSGEAQRMWARYAPGLAYRP